MKIIVTFLIMLAAPSSYAELYKCKINGKTAYQEKPCQGAGTEFELKRDISPEQQQAAKERLEAELAEREEKHRQIEESLIPQAGPTTAIPQITQQRPLPNSMPRRY